MFNTGRRFSVQNYISESEIRTKTAGSQRRQSSDNRRPSIAQFLFGPSPSPQSSPLKTKTQSHLSVDSSASISPRNRRYERRSTFVPPDSRTFHFESASESEDETSAFGIGSEDTHKKTSLTVENHPRRRQSPKPATRNSIAGVNANAQFGGMRKVMRVIVAGKKGVGKTAFLQHLARYHDISTQPYVPTIDDTYQVQTQAEVPNDRIKELIIFHDTAGVSDRGPIEVLKKQYIQIADAFLLFYSVLDFDSFQKMELIKKHIEKHFGKDKKEVPIVVVGTGVDLPGKHLDSASSLLWATREKVKLFEITTRDRNSIVDVVHYLAGKYFHPMKEPKFSITKKLKPEKSNAQIMNAVGKKSSLLHKLLIVETRSRKWNSTMKLPFKIPELIERSPTALLEALADTVGTDPTAPPPGIIDDPATISSQFKRKDYYLTREYGRRAASKLIEEWPTLFMLDRDYPRLPAFRPQKPLDPAVVEPNSKNLKKMLAGKHIEDAIMLFKRMEEQSVEVPNELVHQLFFFACYYNGQAVPMQEKEWPGMRTFYESEPQKRQEEGIVDEFFLLDRLDKTEDVYSAMICNLCKYDSGMKDKENISLKKAKELFKEMLEKELTPAVEVFNYFLLHKISVDDEAPDYSATLKQMAKLGIKPNVETFTNALGCIPMTLPIEERMRLAQSLYAEMVNCGIEPDLTFYSNLIKIPYDPDVVADLPSSKERAISINVLNEILTKFEGRESSIKYSRKTDENFFLTALYVAKKAKNIHIAQRVEKLHSHKNNKAKMTPMITEDRFYYEYLSMMENLLHLDDYFKLYTKYVPSKTNLSPKMASRIITRHLIKTPHWPLTQRIIEDGIAAGHASKLETAKIWQTLLANFPKKELKESQEQEFKNLVKRCVSIWKEFNAEEPMEGEPKRIPFIPVDSFIDHFDFMKLNVVDVK